mmetsp:Transcript_2224/g.5189  ORF Transcript_2224/g.5189 Transcript_2224/m.5189 type:complete len:276 (+) Transcript_2224:2280-3107(+)
MTFCVSVPVLSEAMTVQEPSVSTDSSFLQFTLRSASLRELMVRQPVTQAGRPSGTLATMIPIALMSALMIVVLRLPWEVRPRITAATKKTRPIVTARMVMKCTKRLTSIWRVVGWSPPDDASVAMDPISVLSPIATTIPVASPSTTREPEKAMLRDSIRSSCVCELTTVMGSDSPVSDELSTLRPLTRIMRISAGHFSPDSTVTRSPITRVSAVTRVSTPPRRTRALDGSILAKVAATALFLPSWKYASAHVKVTIPKSTKPRIKLDKPAALSRA